MKTPDARGTIGIVLLLAGAVALVAGPAFRTSHAADPDRFVYEHHGDWDFDEFEDNLAEALAVLEDLELDMDFDDFADNLADQIEAAFEHGAYHIDRDWPDHVRVRGAAPHVDIDTRHIARQVERIARSIERDVRVSERGRNAWRWDSRGWDDDDRDREDIESEMRALQREMRRLSRELEELEAEGDI